MNTTFSEPLQMTPCKCLFGYSPRLEDEAAGMCLGAAQTKATEFMREELVAATADRRPREEAAVGSAEGARDEAAAGLAEGAREEAASGSAEGAREEAAARSAEPATVTWTGSLKDEAYTVFVQREASTDQSDSGYAQADTCCCKICANDINTVKIAKVCHQGAQR
ncbi:hypothetical protein CYMTET_13531 [Cymbomonas tetramitiformis]|uniref:Uncharacterized protein n=1 Tax=Cymbomonas tetramitiformis TaxID=36881 RepID=A0AAE0LAZ2_9CHLO|nr:hypothetical protein CYMTET_13531 [Cymbomonas tetramitiformis]